MLNKAILMGRICNDIDLKYTQSNTPVCSFTLAVDRGYKDANGKKQTDFLDCVSWNKTAEFIRNYMCKGQLIAVVGSIQTRKWTDKNGNERKSVEIKADEVHFAESKKDKPDARSSNSDPVPSNDFAELGDDFSDVPF